MIADRDFAGRIRWPINNAAHGHRLSAAGKGGDSIAAHRKVRTFLQRTPREHRFIT